jgi:hypothetical protein
MTINFTDDNGKKENVFFVQVFDLDDVRTPYSAGANARRSFLP